MSPPLTISAAAALVRDGHLRPRDLVEGCLARIDRWDKQIHAWVVVDEFGALDAATALEEELAAGKYRGSLHGIPIGVKDIVNVAGLPTRSGSPVTPLTAVKSDAPCVAHLRAAGAIVLGKTVTTELACFDPPPTRNPWNPQRTPGGSSSGSAAATALGMCFGAIGSQTGGSILRPATYCGVAGFKPTFDYVSRAGVTPVSEHLDHVGPIARSVGDLALLLHGMTVGAGSPAPFPLDRPPRFGVWEKFFLEDADPAVAKLFRESCQRLLAAGAEIRLAAPPDTFGEVRDMHRRIMVRELAENHLALYRAGRRQFGPVVTSLIEEGLNLKPDAYQVALGRQERFRKELAAAVSGFDALLTPATVTTAPSIDTTGDPRFNSPWSFAGVPAVSFPCGVAGDGLPAGLQLVGRQAEDESLLAMAAWCEQALGPGAPPPMAAAGVVSD